MSANGHAPSTTRSTGTPAPGLSVLERSAAVGIVVMVAVLGLVGAVNSFAAVARAVEPSFGRLAWTVPVGIDVGIAVFTALDLLLARLGMRMRLLRLVPWLLVAVTIYLNVAGEHDLIGAVAHGVLPLLWVIAVESGGHVARTWAGLTSGPAPTRRMDRVRWSRWLLAPSSTVRLWRRMVLWETSSYPEALRRERDRVLARTELQDKWGAVLWRWRAPRRARALYRLGELAPAGALATPNEAPAEAPRPKPRTNGTRRPKGRRTARPAVDVRDLAAAGREVAGELAAEGVGLTRAALVERLRARGLPVSNARAGELLARLRNGQPDNEGLIDEGVAR